MRTPNVFTIPPGVPFLDALVATLLDGRLIPGFDAARPFALADTTIYLPTRRAARAIRERFLARLGRPLLLPKIRTLGDLDEDEASLLDLEAAELPAAVPVLERQLALTGLVLSWSGALAREVAGLPDEELVVPASPADAVRLAASLASLMDQVGTDPRSWRDLREKIPGDLARLWEITLTFLGIVTEAWPAHLAAKGLIDPGARRDLMILREAERLTRQGSRAPVIAAGSTGSVKATAALLGAIARLENGAVVLPGLDQEIDAEAWDAIGTDTHQPAGAGHPQYGLKLLLEGMGVDRGTVVPLAEASEDLKARERLVSEALRPANTTESWRGPAALPDETKRQGAARIGLLEAANEREEALAIALLLRSAANGAGSVAALITPDRGLARRVAIELRRWGIDVDDSAGRPLSLTPSGIFARLVAETALSGVEAETLLALLKHPHAAFGLEPFMAHSAARNLERAALRGPRLKPGFTSIRHALETRSAERWSPSAEDTRDSGRAGTFASRYLSQERWQEAIDLAARVEKALAPLEALSADDRPVSLAALIDAHLAALRTAACDPKGRTTLFSEEAGEALAGLFESLRESAPAGPDIRPSEYSGLFAALIERVAVRRRGGADPRIHIFGALEARLQSVDKVVLGGLNEGTWPGQTRLDPLLSSSMREALALDPPERRIGLAAHDFAQALGHKEVWLTRADREDGAPRVASRWLQRLIAYAGPDLATEMGARGQTILSWARGLDRADVVDPPARPRPSPPVALRPTRLSATRIETLIRDPYAIYAQYVLKLRPFEPLAKLPQAAERGTLVHDILEDFVRERPNGPYDSAAEARLIELGRKAFDELRDFPEVQTLWWPRFEKIARWFVREEALLTDIVTRHVECNGEMPVHDSFTLSARADRIDRLTSGGLQIIDYKTGTPPSAKEVGTLSPQLPLEALIARQAGFPEVPSAEAERIVYYRLNGKGEGGEKHDRTEWRREAQVVVGLAETLETTDQRLRALVAHYAKPETNYPSNKIPKPRRTYVGDYDHLARIAEWVATDQEEDDAPPG